MDFEKKFENIRNYVYVLSKSDNAKDNDFTNTRYDTIMHTAINNFMVNPCIIELTIFLEAVDNEGIILRTDIVKVQDSEFPLIAMMMRFNPEDRETDVFKDDVLSGLNVNKKETKTYLFDKDTKESVDIIKQMFAYIDRYFEAGTSIIKDAKDYRISFAYTTDVMSFGMKTCSFLKNAFGEFTTVIPTQSIDIFTSMSVKTPGKNTILNLEELEDVTESSNKEKHYQGILQTLAMVKKIDIIIDIEGVEEDGKIEIYVNSNLDSDHPFISLIGYDNIGLFESNSCVFNIDAGDGNDESDPEYYFNQYIKNDTSLRITLETFIDRLVEDYIENTKQTLGKDQLRVKAKQNLYSSDSYSISDIERNILKNMSDFKKLDKKEIDIL